MQTALRYSSAPLILSQCALATGRSCLMHLIERYAPEAVFMPQMVPEGLLAPFKQNNVPMFTYKLNTDLSPNMESVRTTVEVRRKCRSLLIVIHYFGYQMPTAELAALVHYAGGLLLSDCAHCLYQSNETHCADLALYSINKFMPVPDGAVLASCSPLADVSISSSKDLKPLDDEVISAYLNHLIMNRALANIGQWDYYAASASILSRDYYERYYAAISSDMKPRRMSRYAMEMYEAVDLKKVAVERRVRARMIIKMLRKRSLFRMDVPDFALPVRARGNRDDALYRLREEGILASVLNEHWRAPGDASGEFWEQHLLLPINEKMTPDQAAKIGAVARRWL